ncbi:hypothetical protein FOL47_005297 [Perkinsus chesapeaki]|uniref:Acetyl-CoA carboxylase n=1 Tax=Perkinsus chesapeaki TaxID=330153 RepID=A0A7J6LXS1_PERCH|nr:hypothetical protein FOL47_005297 [Perkinsus chesapeaki]
MAAIKKDLVSTYSDEEQFRTVIEDQTDKRLHVVDVYTSWQSTSFRIFSSPTQINMDGFDDRVDLIQIDRQTVAEYAEKFQTTSNPRFLFYKDGDLVAEVDGCNAPKILGAVEELSVLSNLMGNNSSRQRGGAGGGRSSQAIGKVSQQQPRRRDGGGSTGGFSLWPTVSWMGISRPTSTATAEAPPPNVAHPEQRRLPQESSFGPRQEPSNALWPTVNWSGQSPLRQQQEQRQAAAQIQQRPVYVFRDGRYVQGPTDDERPYRAAAPYSPFNGMQTIPEIKQTCVVKNPCNIRKDTIKLIEDAPNAPPKLRFAVDTSGPCTVKVHYFVEGNSQEALPEIRGVRTYTYDIAHAGLGQEVITDKLEERLDRREPLPAGWASTTYVRGSHRYPAVIEVTYEGKAEPTQNALHEFCTGQLTYLSFPPAEESDVMMNVKVLKQRVLFSTQAYDVHDIYGIEAAAPRMIPHEELHRTDTVEGKVVDGTSNSPVSSEEESSSDEAGPIGQVNKLVDYDEEADAMASECVICLSEPRTTVVLPCRHMCLCNDCAVRVQEATPGHVSAKCPICRQAVSSMLQIASPGEQNVPVKLGSRVKFVNGWSVCSMAPSPPFTRVLIANRGEEMAPHIPLCDKAVCIGAGVRAYLDVDIITKAAVESECDALHPGYGFLSESWDLAEACARVGVKFIGPAPSVLRAFGDKTAARKMAIESEVPVSKGTARGSNLRPVVKDASTCESEVARLALRYPVVVKAAAGGGGRGMRVTSSSGLKAAFERCTAEAKASFGNGDVFVEEWWANSKHIEVQVLGDSTGEVSHAFSRDCSVQLRNQKVIEIAPPQVPIPEAILRAACGLAKKSGYVSVGTVEFLMAKGGEDFIFLEVNPRIQVEHTVTEEAFGIDLVQIQMRLAAGEPLKVVYPTLPNLLKAKCAIQARVVWTPSSTGGKGGPMVEK